jgi:hypothetical protein
MENMPAEALTAEISAVHALYAALARNLDPETGLGGQLLYAGELNPEGCRLVRAANIAGAASLSATADPAAQKLVIREQVVDFLVNSLDEALRILKNEVRKRQTVAVGVSVSPAQIVGEMKQRGVLPDLLPPANPQSASPELDAFIIQGARQIELQPLPPDRVFVAVDHPPSDFESRALASIPINDHATRRWLRLSPRYLGPAARRMRSLSCDPKLAASLTVPSP